MVRHSKWWGAQLRAKLVPIYWGGVLDGGPERIQQTEQPRGFFAGKSTRIT
jgi:hypothetical protein